MNVIFFSVDRSINQKRTENCINARSVKYNTAYKISVAYNNDINNN